MNNLEHDLIASGYTPVPLGQKGIIAWTGWMAPPDGRHANDTDQWLLHRLWL